MTDNETDRKILAEIGELRARNRGIYATLECLFGGGDRTLDLMKLAYATDPEKAKEWHRQAAEIDAKILELTRKLCA
jgi:hypothetical protein